MATPSSNEFLRRARRSTKKSSSRREDLHRRTKRRTVNRQGCRDDRMDHCWPDSVEGARSVGAVRGCWSRPAEPQNPNRPNGLRQRTDIRSFLMRRYLPKTQEKEEKRPGRSDGGGQKQQDCHKNAFFAPKQPG